MWESALDRMLSRLIVSGVLFVTWPDGKTKQYGSEYGPPIAPHLGPVRADISLKDRAILRPLVMNPVLALGEGYMDGQIDTRDLKGLLAFLVRNQDAGNLPVWVTTWQSMRTSLRRFAQINNPWRSRRNVAHHYDISNDLYRQFLDEDMQYSCAYFKSPDMSLEAAQIAKKNHIAAKLMIKPGMRVLDIGCGWGGMALTLARDYGAYVTGVTLSENQLVLARERVQAAGLQDRIDLRLQDYRKVSEPFDRIVSVGMLEHVGLPQFQTYFDKVHDLLTDDGIALIHTIGWTGPPSSTSPWIAKYIFPGGYVPAMSDLAPAIEKSGLWQADIEVWRGQYGPTLHHWRRRFEAALPEIRKTYDVRFERMFRFYLVACEVAFEFQTQAVFHFQLSKQQMTVPVTRDYLYEQGSKPETERSIELVHG